MYKRQEKGPPLKKKRTTDRNLQRYVNILDISAKLFANYTGISRHACINDVLIQHKDSLKIIYMVAVGIRAVIESIILNSKAEEVDSSSHAFFGLSLSVLLPGIRRQNTTLSTKCVHITEELFSKNHNNLYTEKVASESVSQNDDEFEKDESLAHCGEEDGVFRVL